MDIAIVTGANTRTGLAISQTLIDTGCRVYGLGSDFENFPLEHTDFVPVTCDLTNTEHLCQVVQEIMDKEKDIYVLVNHARFLNVDPHEKLSLNDLESLVHTNLLAPLILTRLVLPSLIRLRGYVLNIGFPDLPGSRRLGSAFLSTEVALQEFSNRLYEEVRQDRVKVCSLILDSANAEGMFREGFTERDNHDLIVCSNAIAQAVDYIVSQKRESVVSTLMVRPQKREPDAEDRESARKLAAPKPYAAKRGGKKVVMGRLKKKEEAPVEDNSPASYIEMAREIAEEEAKKRKAAQRSREEIQSDESVSPPNRNRRRRRGRGRGGKTNRQEESSMQPSSEAQTSSKEQNKPSEKKRPSRRKPRNDSGDRALNQQQDRTKRFDDKAPETPKEQAPPKEAKKKIATKKSVSKKAVKKKTAPKKGAVKKIASKRVAKKAAKKTANKKTAKKRPSSEN